MNSFSENFDKHQIFEMADKWSSHESIVSFGFHISGLLQNRGVASTSYVLRVRVTSTEHFAETLKCACVHTTCNFPALAEAMVRFAARKVLDCMSLLCGLFLQNLPLSSNQ